MLSAPGLACCVLRASVPHLVIPAPSRFNTRFWPYTEIGVTVEKRYQVFISTTYPDMQGARQALMPPLLDLGMLPMGMDPHSANGNDQMPLVQRLIDDSDYFVILLGGRYGGLSPLGLSYPHREYIFAATKRKPVITFLHDQPSALPEEARESSREGQVRRDDFARLLESKTLCYRWRQERDLQQLVARVMPEVMRRHPADGWVKGGRATPGGDESEELRARIAALEKEREALLGGLRTPVRNLARGGDEVPLDYSCDVYEGGDCKIAMASCRLDWDRIFACVAPLMLNPVSEAVMCKALEEYIARQALGNVSGDFPRAHAVRNVRLAGHTFNQIKVQLRALGLIAKAAGQDAGGLPLWRLTAQGDATMNQVMAQRRG